MAEIPAELRWLEKTLKTGLDDGPPNSIIRYPSNGAIERPVDWHKRWADLDREHMKLKIELEEAHKSQNGMMRDVLALSAQVLEQALRQIQQVMRTSAWYDDLERVGPIVDAALVSLHAIDKAVKNEGL